MTDKPAQQMNPVIVDLARKIANLEVRNSDLTCKLDMLTARLELANEMVGQLQAEIAKLKEPAGEVTDAVPPAAARKSNGARKAAA